jgi:DNA-binding response OmpR family regulator
MDWHTAGSAEAAAQTLSASKASAGPAFDLILLDVMMTGRSGWEFLEQLRAEGDTTPTIFKPFAFEELLARIDF